MGIYISRSIFNPSRVINTKNVINYDFNYFLQRFGYYFIINVFIKLSARNNNNNNHLQLRHLNEIMILNLS